MEKMENWAVGFLLLATLLVVCTAIGIQETAERKQQFIELNIAQYNATTGEFEIVDERFKEFPL